MPVASSGALVEDAVEDDEVEMKMRVEGGARPTLRVGARWRNETAPS
jgi:hypothetical protein